MSERRWYRDPAAIAAWVTGTGIFLATILPYLWPPDPAHPPGDRLVEFFRDPPLAVRIPSLVLLMLSGSWVGFNFGSRGRSKEETPPSIPVFSDLFELHAHNLEQRITDPKNQAVYTAKTRLILENKTANSIQISHAKWLTGELNVSVQCGASPYAGEPYKFAGAEFCCWYQREECKGSWKKGIWKKKANGDDEGPSIFIESGFSFRVWIGLNPCVPESTMQQKKNTRQLGTLILPVEINGQHHEVSIQI
jgi:hypothetical protein